MVSTNGCNNGTSEVSDSTEYDKYQNHDGHIVVQSLPAGPSDWKGYVHKALLPAPAIAAEMVNAISLNFVILMPTDSAAIRLSLDCHDGTSASGIYQILYDKQCNQNQNNSDWEESNALHLYRVHRYRRYQVHPSRICLPSRCQIKILQHFVAT